MHKKNVLDTFYAASMAHCIDTTRAEPATEAAMRRLVTMSGNVAKGIERARRCNIPGKFFE